MLRVRRLLVLRRAATMDALEGLSGLDLFLDERLPVLLGLSQAFRELADADFLLSLVTLSLRLEDSNDAVGVLTCPMNLVLESLLLLRADEVDPVENLGELRDTVSGVLLAAGDGLLELVAFLASALDDVI